MFRASVRNFNQFLNYLSLKTIYSRRTIVLGSFVPLGLTYYYFEQKNIYADNFQKYIIEQRVPYLIVGGGASGYSTAIGILNNDPKAKILIVTKEAYKTYMKPMLSKDLWNIEDLNLDDIRNKNNEEVFITNSSMECNLMDLFSNENASLAYLTNHEVIHLNTNIREVTLKNGQKIKFNKIVLATGISTKLQPEFETIKRTHPDKISSYQTIDDFINLKQVVDSKDKTILFYDSGLTGTELVSSLSNELNSKKNNKLILAIPGKGILDYILPKEIAEELVQFFEINGVKVIKDAKIENIATEEERLAIRFPNEKVIVDYVVDSLSWYSSPIFTKGKQCTGYSCPEEIKFNDSFSAYLTNPMLQSGGKDIFVVGDAAAIFEPTFMNYRQICHFSNAVDSAEDAAKNITESSPTNYSNIPPYWTEMFGKLKIQGMGKTDASLKTVSVFEEGFNKDMFKKGVIFYIENGVVVGVVSFNLPTTLHITERIIKSQTHCEDPKNLARYYFQEKQ